MTSRGSFSSSFFLQSCFFSQTREARDVRAGFGLVVRRGFVLGLMSTLVACQVKIPTPEEQAELAKRGAFSMGAPAWSGSRGGSMPPSSGIIPQQFGLSQPQVARVEVAHLADVEIPNAAKSAETVPSTMVKLESPLDRINSVCPQLEGEVNSAITTLTLNERMAKYQSLAMRCTRSADLWVWFGQDAMKAGKFADAKRGFDEALALDSQNTAAKNGLSELAARMSPSGK